MGYTYAADVPVAQLDTDSRSSFIGRTYAHLFGAMVAFTLIEVFIFKSGFAEPITKAMLSVPWLVILGAFFLVSWVAQTMAGNARSLAAQYLGLLGYVIAEAFIFVPLLFIADRFAPGVIGSAAAVTLAGFFILTAIVFFTRKDFSFLRGVLCWGGAVALMLIVCGAIFGFNLGTYFSVGMIGYAGAAVLYTTSNVLHHYPEDRYVGAALHLFAAVALLLWYVIRLMMAFSRD